MVRGPSNNESYPYTKKSFSFQWDEEVQHLLHHEYVSEHEKLVAHVHQPKFSQKLVANQLMIHFVYWAALQGPQLSAHRQVHRENQYLFHEWILGEEYHTRKCTCKFNWVGISKWEKYNEASETIFHNFSNTDGSHGILTVQKSNRWIKKEGACRKSIKYEIKESIMSMTLLTYRGSIRGAKLETSSEEAGKKWLKSWCSSW